MTVTHIRIPYSMVYKILQVIPETRVMIRIKATKSGLDLEINCFLTGVFCVGIYILPITHYEMYRMQDVTIPERSLLFDLGLKN